MRLEFRRLPITLLVLLLALACASEPALEAEEAQDESTTAASQEADVAASSDTFYAIGFFLSSQLGPFNLTAEELEQVQKGIVDGALGKEPAVDMQAEQAKVQALAQSRAEMAAAEEKEAAGAFLTEQAQRDGVEVTESGLIFESLVEGDGASPAATDRVQVHYHGTLRDGSVFDSSVDRGQPATFGLNQVIKCWTEGVQKMKVGGKARLVCPSDLAYGDRGAPPRIAPGAPLVFEVELLEIVAAES
ncbi:MAG: FKBP-type peptidyl-prolyl cis-trans isomerase [Acidobacteriota bacterium]